MAGTDSSRTIRFNPANTWGINPTQSDYGANGTLDVGTVAIHELGHALGLDHPNPLHSDSTMFQGYDGTLNTTWHADDLNGLAYLYGPAVGTDYHSAVKNWNSLDDMLAFDNRLTTHAIGHAASSSFAFGQQLPALASGYWQIAANGVLWSWDVSWSLPEYGPQEAIADSPLTLEELALAANIWTGQNVFAPDVAPIPEPATLSLLFLGGLALLRRKANRAA